MRRPRHSSTLVVFALSVLCCTLLVAGCGQASGQAVTGSASNSQASSSPTVAATVTKAASTRASGATLHCTMREEPVTTDTVSAMLSCAIAHAASGETSFTLSYISTGLKGQGNVVDATCHGPLHNGGGACTMTMMFSAHNSAPGSVTGELLPSRQTLGPETPTLVS